MDMTALPEILQEQLAKSIFSLKLAGSDTPELDAINDMICKSQHELADILEKAHAYREMMSKSTREIDGLACFLHGDGYLSKSEIDYYAEEFPGGEWKEIDGTTIYMTPLAKSHIKQYARQDGTIVKEHDDKRTKKHQDLIGHQNNHGEEIHSGAKLEHGDALIEHLRSQGWKEKEVPVVRSKNGPVAGKKEDMPEHEEIKAKNRDNSALQTAERAMKKMREAAANSDDPVAVLQHMNTSRSNTYTAAIDDYREKLLNHYGHEVDRNKSATKFEKDGHAIVIGKEGDKHTVHYAGADTSKDDGKTIGSLAGKKEVESVDTGKKDAKFITGRDNKAYTAKLNPVQSKYALVEAHHLTTSHTIQGHVNKAYPQEIQPRERERLSSQMQMANIMNDIKPELFGHSATAADGAPIVGKDGAVESGNGRTIALTEAYKRGKADKYKEWLKKEAESFGLKPEDVEGMEQPMLVRLRDDDDPNTDRAEFAREANQSSNLGSSPAEQAWSDAERIDDALLKKFTVDEDGEIFNEDNADFINGFLDKLGKNEAASLRDADGDPNKKAIERIQNAVFTKVYGSSMLTELQAESAKPKIRNVLKALNACVADFAQVKDHDDLNVVPDMMEAIEYTLAHQNVSKAEMEHTLKNAQSLNFTGDTPAFKTEHATNMILAIADRSGSRNRLENVFRAISNEIKNEVAQRDNPEVDMFSGPYQPKNKEQVVKQALDKVGGDVQKAMRTAFDHTFRNYKPGAWLLRKSNSNHEPKGGGDGEKGGQFAPRDIEQDVEAFSNVLETFKTDQLDMRRPAKVMDHTPLILRQLGAKNREIDIDPNDMKKILLSWRQEGGKHGIPAEIAKNIPKWLSDPIMVFDSNTRPNSLVIVTEAEHENQPIYVMIHLEKDRGRRHYVNRVASTYNRPDSDVEYWVKKGLLRCYDEKKGSEWLRARGLRLPTAGTSLQSLSKKTVLLKSKQVNYIIVNKSLAGTYLIKSARLASSFSPAWIPSSGSLTSFDAVVGGSEFTLRGVATDNRPVTHGKTVIITKPHAALAAGNDIAGTVYLGNKANNISSHNTLQTRNVLPDSVKTPAQNDTTSHYPAGLYLLKKSIGGEHGRTDRRREIRPEEDLAGSGTESSGRDGQKGHREDEIRKSEEALPEQAGEGSGQEKGRTGRRAGTWLIKGIIRKSQMALDFSSHDHHVAYTRTNASGTVSQIQAKGAAQNHAISITREKMVGLINEYLTPKGITFNYGKATELKGATGRAFLKERRIITRKDAIIDDLAHEIAHIVQHDSRGETRCSSDRKQGELGSEHAQLTKDIANELKQNKLGFLFQRANGITWRTMNQDIDGTPAPTGAATLADRQRHAMDRFEQSLQTIAGITPKEAARVMQAYIDNKMVKVDSVIGQITPKHGSYLDKEMILNAVRNTAPEPWQQTKEEFGNDEDHAGHVFRALQQGKPVPTEVKAQYPEFAYLTRDSKLHLRKSLAGVYLLRKAHVAAYDRTTKTGALAHIAAHEDSRVKRYEIKLGRTRNSAEVHKLRMERFAHLPHWGSLDDHTKQAVLDAEDEKHAEHKHFEDWHDKHVKKKSDAPGSDKIDRSGWEQNRLFKARRRGLFLIRKR